ncbi:hypothetical protein GWK47_029837 [Chionoecetes opilio]|uniref:Uncharacterized protein n=1 Tax=Chionoecetes opilio TaxID=41210 RepID=A0A8J5D5G0_CHIOP|nr:hypothetical protein GWK47_029837 [Chionoecetes opilio]
MVPKSARQVEARQGGFGVGLGGRRKKRLLRPQDHRTHPCTREPPLQPVPVTADGEGAIYRSRRGCRRPRTHQLHHGLAAAHHQAHGSSLQHPVPPLRFPGPAAATILDTGSLAGATASAANLSVVVRKPPTQPVRRPRPQPLTDDASPQPRPFPRLVKDSDGWHSIVSTEVTIMVTIKAKGGGSRLSLSALVTIRVGAAPARESHRHKRRTSRVTDIPNLQEIRQKIPLCNASTSQGSVSRKNMKSNDT